MNLTELSSRTKKNLELTNRKRSFLEKNKNKVINPREEKNGIHFNDEKHNEPIFLIKLNLFHSNLTVEEKSLCLAFYEGKSASAIALEKNSSLSKIKERKDKLKRKLGLNKQESITKYLKELVI